MNIINTFENRIISLENRLLNIENNLLSLKSSQLREEKISKIISNNILGIDE